MISDFPTLTMISDFPTLTLTLTWISDEEINLSVRNLHCLFVFAFIPASICGDRYHLVGEIGRIIIGLRLGLYDACLRGTPF